ncbi:MAG: hypothetical protein NTY02_12160, partial [Acidobacteria bacterium]|nr:hypothetical protein [Acidobacteriota bacterium]
MSGRIWFILEVGLGADDVEALHERRLDDGVDIRHGRVEIRPLRCLDPGHPERRAVGIEDEHPQPVFRLAGGDLGNREVLLPLSDLRPCRHEVERWRLADVHAGLVDALEVARQVEGALLHVDQRPGRDQVPVRLLHVGERPHHRLAEAGVGNLLVALAQNQLLATGVDSQVLQQRLEECRLEARRHRRVVVGEYAVRPGARRVPPGGVAATEPRQTLRHGRRTRGRRRLCPLIPDQEVAGRRQVAVAGEERRHRRNEGRLGLPDTLGGDLRVHPVDLEIHVVLQAHADGVLEGEPEDG